MHHRFEPLYAAIALVVEYKFHLFVPQTGAELMTNSTQDLEQNLQTSGFFRSLWIAVTVGARTSANIMMAGNDVATLARASTSYGKAVLERELKELQLD